MRKANTPRLESMVLATWADEMDTLSLTAGFKQQYEQSRSRPLSQGEDSTSTVQSTSTASAKQVRVDDKGLSHQQNNVHQKSGYFLASLEVHLDDSGVVGGASSLH